ncbi:MAG: carbonic anhydrase [Cyclobacteriaceae bacterium]|nr:carbonic anhydrase [Cyclobacteriaceae bacterium]
MKPSLQQLLQGNQRFIEQKLRENSSVFKDSSQGQHPKVLWIGCSDSRIDPNEITQTGIGDLFVHRNIANLVVEYDLNFLSVLQYAVEVLKVEDVIVCGHYGCGGVNAALKGDQLGLIDNWLAHIKSAHQYYAWEIDQLTDEKSRARRLVELNVLEQVNVLGKTRIIREAWEKGIRPTLNGWVYDIETGKINVLHDNITNLEQLKVTCKFERRIKFEAENEK